MKDPEKYYFPEIENLDIPGLDHPFEHHGIYYMWQPETGNSNRGMLTTSGRWVLTNKPNNPNAAFLSYYNGDYYRIDQALEDFKNKMNANK